MIETSLRFGENVKAFELKRFGVFIYLMYTDSMRITCFYPSVDNMSLFTDTVRLDRNHILMETYTSGVGPEIPIMSYTSGIPNQVGIWYCGLRDSKVEPRKWHEKYGIDNYVYYTIRIEEDKPSSNDSFYIKISK